MYSQSQVVVQLQQEELKQVLSLSGDEVEIIGLGAAEK